MEVLQEIHKSLEGISILSIPLYDILEAIVLLVICAVAIKIILIIARKALTRSKSNGAVQGFVKSGLKFILWLIALIIIASALGVNTASLVALLGVVGLALSLAVQGLVSNIFSGFTLLGAKPFSPGDYIQVGSYEGHVKEIGIFYTKIVTLDNKLVFFPNAKVTGDSIVNFTAMHIRRVEVILGVSYDENPDEVIRALEDTMQDMENTLNEPAPMAGIWEYGDSSIAYTARVWADSEVYWPVYFELRRRVWKTFKDRDIEISYPHMNVHIKEQ